MEVNASKNRLLLSGKSRGTATIDTNYNESENEQVFLGIAVDSNLTFETYINSICKKACKKLNALARMASYLIIQGEEQSSSYL